MSDSNMMQELKTAPIERADLEQRFLILEPSQREIVQLLLQKEEALNAFQIRMEIYQIRTAASYSKDAEKAFEAGIQSVNPFASIQRLEQAKRNPEFIKAKKQADDFFSEIKAKKPFEWEKAIREEAKKHSVSLPSGTKIKHDLELLQDLKFIEPVVNNRFCIAFEFRSKWVGLRETIIKEIGSNKLSLAALTPLSKSFWQLF